MSEVFEARVLEAWTLSGEGKIAEARKAYADCDNMGFGGRLDPGLSVLRQNIGLAKGKVVPIPATEDRVVTFVLAPLSIESVDGGGLETPVIDVGKLEAAIRNTLSEFDPPVHKNNIAKELPHVLFLSTGRCGTRSVQRFLMPSEVFAYHDYWFMLALETRWEQMCAVLDGGFSFGPCHQWAQCRAAEWLGAISYGVSMVGVNHLDTVFAPAFAAIHPKSKFVHLYRDRMDTFDSFVMKDQWRSYQLRPLNYSMHPYFRWRCTGHDLCSCLAWYIRFTEVFAEAMERVLKDRFISISADKLFAQDSNEIDRMLDFIGVDLPKGQRVFPHINKKAHKIVVEEEDMPPVRGAFQNAYARLKAENRL